MVKKEVRKKTKALRKTEMKKKYSGETTKMEKVDEKGKKEQMNA